MKDIFKIEINVNAQRPVLNVYSDGEIGRDVSSELMGSTEVIINRAKGEDFNSKIFKKDYFNGQRTVLVGYVLIHIAVPELSYRNRTFRTFSTLEELCEYLNNNHYYYVGDEPIR